MFDLSEILSTPGVLLLEPQDLAHTDTLTPYVDMSGYESCAFYVLIGALTGVDGSNYLTPILQESDDTTGAGAASVAAGDIKGPGFSKVDAASEDSVVQCAVYVGAKRYVGVSLDYTGAGISAGVIGVIAVPGKPIHAPVTSPAAVART